MFNVIPPSSLSSAWLFLSMWERLFVVWLAALSVYALFVAVSTGMSVRKTRAYIREGKSVDFESDFIALRKRSARLQNLIETGLYLFGAVLFLSLEWVYFANDMRSGSGERVILIGFYRHFVLAFYVFLAFLVLHLLRWLVSISADAFGLHLKPPQQT